MIFIFYYRESELELKEYESLLENHYAINASVNYLSEYLSDIHYNRIYSYNNCTKFVKDPCYKNISTEGYFSACGPSECSDTPFCVCIRQFKRRFEVDVSKGPILDRETT